MAMGLSTYLLDFISRHYFHMVNDNISESQSLWLLDKWWDDLSKATDTHISIDEFKQHNALRLKLIQPPEDLK